MLYLLDFASACISVLFKCLASQSRLVFDKQTFQLRELQ